MSTSSEPTVGALAGSGDGVSRVQRVMRDVAAHIRKGGLKVGDQLPSEIQLSQALGVSRSVIREAFGALAALGVVDVGNGRRPRVAAVNAFPMVMTIDHALHTGQVTFAQVWDVRRRLEMGTAALAARHRTPEQAERIVGLARAMADCEPRSKELTRLDIAFHAAIAAASGNILFEQIAAAFYPLMARAVPLAWSTRMTPSSQADTLNQHARVAQAIADGDPQAAEAAMGLHFDQSILATLSTAALPEPDEDAAVPADRAVPE